MINRFNSFEEAFIAMINDIYVYPEFICESRNGEMYEKFSKYYVVEDPRTYEFKNKDLGRIDYEYADHFYNWMISGCSDEATEEFKQKYKHVSGFLSKPKSKNLPDNFNVFYGPRIVRQLPTIIEELKTSKNSRRAVINILTEEDQKLFDAHEDQNLEYPCADSSTFSIRDGKLYQHLHMRSNNMGNVAKLDMYLWGRFQCELAEQLNVDLGTFTCSIVSAHIFSKDFDYFFDVGLFNEFDSKREYLLSLLNEFKENNNTLSFIRHQQTEANKNRIIRGQTDSPLIETEDQDELIKNLNLPKNPIYFTSELNRAQETLKLIDPKAIYYPTKLLNEIDWGDNEGLSGEDIFTDLEELIKYYFFYGEIDRKLRNSGETIGDVIDRFITGIRALRYHENSNIVIVGHGLYHQVIKYIIDEEINYKRLDHLTLDKLI